MARAAAAPPDQPTYWNEEGGQRWDQNIQRVERMLEPLSDRLLRHARPRAGERVLDVGCGGGVTSAAFAKAVGPSGDVLGLDVSAVILAVARERFAEVANLAFALGDAEKMHLTAAAFDLVSSRFGVMFFADPAAAFTNLRGTLTVGGRLAFICWRALDENPWMAECVKAGLSSAAPPNLPFPASFSPRTARPAHAGPAGIRHCVRRPDLAALQTAPGRSPHRGPPRLQVRQNLPNHHRVLDAGDHPHLTAAVLAALQIELEDPLQPLRPAHGAVALGRRAGGRHCRAAPPPRRRDLRPPPVVRREHAVIPRQVHPRFRHQGGQPCDEVLRREDHVGRAVPIEKYRQALTLLLG